MLKKKLALILVMLMLFSISYADTTAMLDAERFDIGNRDFVVNDEAEGLIGALHLFDDEAIIKVGSTSEGNGSDEWDTEMKYRMIEAQAHIMTDFDDDEFPLNSEYLPKVGKFEYSLNADDGGGNNLSFDLNTEDIDALAVTTPSFAIAVHIEVINKDEYLDVLEDYNEYEDEEITIKEFINMKKEDIEEDIEEAYEEYLDEEAESELTLEEFIDEDLTDWDLFYFELEIITGWTSEERFNEDKDWASYDDRGIQIEPAPDEDEDPEPEPGEYKAWKTMEPNTRGNKFGHLKKIGDMTQEEFKLEMKKIKELNKKGGFWKFN